MKTRYFYKYKLSETHLAIADLMPVGQGWLITRINVPAAHRGQGWGRQLLADILHDADLEQVILCVEPLASGGSAGGLGQCSLEAWYTRHGFRRVANHFWMRHPVAPLPLQNEAKDK